MTCWSAAYDDKHRSGILSRLRALRTLCILTFWICMAAGETAGSVPTPMVIGWGYNDYGQASPPAARMVNIIAIAAGHDHSIVLTREGEAIAWDSPETLVPQEARTNVVAIAAGTHHSLALKNNGTVIAWGRNDAGQTIVPASLRDVIGIAAGAKHSLALKRDGSVVAWGYNESGQTNVPAAAQSGVVRIVSGTYAWHSAALKADGSFVAWGGNNAHLLQRAGVTQVSSIACGYDHTVVIKDGGVIAWEGSHGNEIVVPDAAKSGVIAVSAGMSHTLALKSDGSTVVWGMGTPIHAETEKFGQLILPEAAQRGVVAISAGGLHNLALLAPVLTGFPAWQTRELGQTADFRVDVSVTPVSYQWRKERLLDNGQTVPADLPGETNAFLRFGVTHMSQAGDYSVLVRNAVGAASNVPPARLTVVPPQAPRFFQQPTNATVAFGQPLRLESTAIGTLLDYQWFKDGVRLTVGTNFALLTNDLYAASARLEHAGAYTLVVSNPGGSITSSPPAVVRVLAPVPYINGPLTNLTLGIGERGSFSVDANKFGVDFQWRKDGVAIPGATNSSLVFESARVEQQGIYTVVVSNSSGTVTSGGMVLTVLVYPPVITVQPKTQTIELGQRVTLSATVTGGLLQYQWRKDGTEIPGATNSIYVIEEATAQDLGVYSLVVGNERGTVTTAPASIRLKPVGAVVAWGANQQGQANVPLEARSGIVAIAAGALHTLALKTNGAVIAWGLNSQGQCNVPLAAQSGVVAIAAGDGHSVALLTDGSVIAWGDNTFGQLYTPAAARGVVAIAAGVRDTVALKEDGSVIVWGELAQASGVPAYVPPGAASGIRAIAAASWSMAALKNDGSVLVWRRNLVNDGTDIPQPAGASSGVEAIASGFVHTLALKQDGSVLAWGYNQQGQANVPAAANSGVIAVAGAATHSVALKNDGSIVVWGGGPFWDQYNLKRPPLDTHGAVAVSAGASHIAVLVPERLPTLTTAPTNQTVELGRPTILRAVAEGYYLEYQWLKDGVPISGATGATYLIGRTAMSDAGEYSQVIKNPVGSVTSGPARLTVIAVPPAIVTQPVSRTIEEGESASLFATVKGSLLTYQWFKDGESIPGATGLTLNLGRARTNFTGQYTLVISNLLGSATSEAASLLVTESSRPLRMGGAALVWAAGTGSPLKIPSAAQSGVIEVATGGFDHAMHTLALKLDGTVVAWGNNDFGQTDVPPGLSNVTAIAAAGSHSVALKRDGSVVTWGINNVGQLDVPAEAQSGVVAIAAGGQSDIGFTVALKSDGAVVAWGASDSSVTEIPHEARSGVIAIAASPTMWPSHVLALKSDGSVVAWGSNETGESDVPENARSGVTAIAAGAYHSLALKQDGTVIAWGNDGAGTPSAVPPEASSNVVAIAAGYHQSLALKRDGSIVSWAGSRVTQSPAFMASAIAAGPYHNVAVVPPTLPSITLQPSSVTVSAGERASFSVAATGYPVAYQWQRDGVAVPEATGSTFNIRSAQSALAGEYTVVASTGAGSVTSAPVRLEVNAAVPMRSGAVMAIGNNDFGQSDVPAAALEGVIAVATGEYHSLALKADGTVLAWGNNDSGQCDVPEGARSNVVAIAAGPHHSLALRSDGSVFVWGNNDSGQQEIPVEAQSGVVGIAAIGYGSAALKADGSIVSWPGNTWGQPEGQSDVTAVATLWWGRGLLLKADSSVIWWERGGGGMDMPIRQPYVAVTNGAVAIAAGQDHGVILKADGSVQTLRGSFETPAEATNGVVRILAAGGLSFAFKADGSIIGWGVDNYTGEDASRFASSGLLDIAASPYHALFLGVPSAPRLLAAPTNQTVEVGQVATLTVRADGFPLNFQWRKNGIAIPGATASAYSFQVAEANLSPREQSAEYSVVITNHLGSVTNVASARVTATAFAPIITRQPASQTTTLGQPATFSVEATGTELRYQWRRNGVNISGATAPTYYVQFPELNDTSEYTVVVSNFLGSSISPVPVTVTVSAPLPGAVVAWGAQGWPAGTPSEQITIPIEARGGVSAIAAGVMHTLALKSDGSVVAWGNNDYGESTVPPVAQSGVSAIAVGHYHNVVLKNDGSVVAWGRGWEGQTTVPAEALTGVMAVAAGGAHSMALKTDGTVLNWGHLHNGSGMVVATVPAGLANVKAIAAGAQHSLALKQDGTVVAWGAMYNGSSWVPATAPAGLAGVTAIAAGEQHAVALKGDGAVVAWGTAWSNGWTPVTVPLQAQSGVVSVDAGWRHIVAHKADGSTVVWGLPAPVPSALQSLVTSVDAGDRHVVALLGAVPLSPALSIELDGPDLILSWPDKAAGYTLQYTTNLADPDSWRNLLTRIAAGQSLIDSTSGPAKFYRLKQER